jgi:hypothetical protein
MEYKKRVNMQSNKTNYRKKMASDMNESRDEKKKESARESKRAK